MASAVAAPSPLWCASVSNLREARASLRAAAKGITVDGSVLATIDVAMKAEIEEMIAKLNGVGSMAKVNHVSVVYASDPRSAQHGKIFAVAGIFTSNGAAENYMGIARQESPQTHFRCLSMFEGRFTDFIEYEALDA